MIGENENATEYWSSITHMSEQQTESKAKLTTAAPSTLPGANHRTACGPPMRARICTRACRSALTACFCACFGVCERACKQWGVHHCWLSSSTASRSSSVIGTIILPSQNWSQLFATTSALPFDRI